LANNWIAEIRIARFVCGVYTLRFLLEKIG